MRERGIGADHLLCGLSAMREWTRPGRSTEGSRKVGLRRKATSKGNFRDAEVPECQERLRPFKPHAGEVPMRRRSHASCEHAEEMKRAQAGHCGQVIQADVVLD